MPHKSQSSPAAIFPTNNPSNDLAAAPAASIALIEASDSKSMSPFWSNRPKGVIPAPTIATRVSGINIIFGTCEMNSSYLVDNKTLLP
jgi:hypothetical protein